MKKLKTINLKGREYVQVNERVLYFNEAFPNGKIFTVPTFQDDTVYFKAEVCPDVAKPERFFTGHSFGTLKGEKALEKLETVAVGRALAFMGIGIVESIASADEMNRFNQKQSVGVCSTCGANMVLSKTGNLYCPNVYSKDPNNPHKTKPKELTKEEEDFLASEY